MTQELLAASLDQLLARARVVRDDAHGTRITYSPKVFIPLTMLCRDKCGYCTFAQPPARLEAPYLTPEQVLRIAKDGARMGCHEALFTLGEAPEERYEVARSWLREHGYESTVAYVHAMAKLVLDETGLLPHANAGARRCAATCPATAALPTRPPSDGWRRWKQQVGPVCRSPPASSSASAKPVKTASPRSRRSLPRTSCTVTCRR